MAVYVKISTIDLNSFVYITGIDVKSQNAFFLMRAIQAVWTDNISRFFQRHETNYHGKFRSSPHAAINTIFHCEVSRNSIVGRIDTSNAKYINYLIFGSPMSRGAYVPALGARIHTGVWRGIPTIYWTTWLSFFRRRVFELIEEFGFDTKRRRPVRHRSTRDLQNARVKAISNIRTGLQKGVIYGYI